jgi:hypothetical protein
LVEILDLELSVVFVNIVPVANKCRSSGAPEMPTDWTDCLQPMQNWSRFAEELSRAIKYAIA